MHWQSQSEMLMEIIRSRQNLIFSVLMGFNAITDVPLVLHGGSGIPEDQLAEAFSRGINKFNYGTDTMHCYDDAVLAYHKACEPAGSNDMVGEAEYVQKAITEFLAKKLDLVKL